MINPLIFPIFILRVAHPPPPLMGEGRGEGDEAGAQVAPPTPPHKGEGLLVVYYCSFSPPLTLWERAGVKVMMPIPKHKSPSPALPTKGEGEKAPPSRGDGWAEGYLRKAKHSHERTTERETNAIFWGKCPCPVVVSQHKGEVML